MKTKHFVTTLAILCVVLTVPCFAADHRWSFDDTTHTGLMVLGGEATSALGVLEHSIALDGISIVQVKNSATMTHCENGFTISVWVNPYASKNGQQMIVAKNRYSLNEREWGMIIDKDGRYTLYVRQDGWSTLASDVLPTVGKWQHIAIAISDGAARLWVNGRSAGSLELDRPIPKTEAPLIFGGVNDNGRIWQIGVCT
jgi:hypothetical protein